MYQIKKKIFTGESFDKETIDQLVSLCENHPNNQVSPFFVWDLLSKQMDRKCKVYMKNKRILSRTSDGVAGFVIYTFEKKHKDEGNCKIKDTTLTTVLHMLGAVNKRPFSIPPSPMSEF